MRSFKNIVSRYELEQLQPTIKQLATILASAPQAKLATVYQKYSNKKFMKIARYKLINHTRIFCTLIQVRKILHVVLIKLYYTLIFPLLNLFQVQLFSESV